MRKVITYLLILICIVVYNIMIINCVPDNNIISNVVKKEINSDKPNPNESPSSIIYFENNKTIQTSTEQSKIYTFGYKTVGFYITDERTGIQKFFEIDKGPEITTQSKKEGMFVTSNFIFDWIKILNCFGYDINNITNELEFKINARMQIIKDESSTLPPWALEFYEDRHRVGRNDQNKDEWDKRYNGIENYLTYNIKGNYNIIKEIYITNDGKEIQMSPNYIVIDQNYITSYMNKLKQKGLPRIIWDFSWEGEAKTNLALCFRYDNHIKFIPKNITPPTPPPITSTSKYMLNYDELSKEFEFVIGNGTPLTASIDTPLQRSDVFQWSYEWTSNTIGSLDVTINDKSGVVTNPYISESGSIKEEAVTVSRKPVIGWITKREAFGDNPLANKYAAGPCVLSKYFDVISHGKISRNYTETYYTGYNLHSHSDTCYKLTCSNTDASHTHDNTCYSLTCGYTDGQIIYTGYTQKSGTKEGYFPDFYTNPSIEIQALVYNGKKNIPNISLPIQDENKSLYQKIQWISEPIEVKVHRWMKHADKNGNSKETVAVPCQYKRIFKGVNTAEITYTKITSLKDWFDIDITNAKNRRTGASNYPHAPFATEPSLLKKYAYPLKAGYYCNPGGIYKVAVKTVIYKKGEGESAEHKDLVEKIKQAFRYQSDLQYTINGKDVYNINYPKNSSGLVNTTLKSLIVKPVLLPYDTKGEGANTHKYYKQILEGWKESNTEDSYKTYKYREYVSKGDIYEVTEETVIYFKINESNKKYYTYVDMPDGEYFIKAFLESFKFKDKTVKPMVLDSIEIHIQGTMYDDLYNQEYGDTRYER